MLTPIVTISEVKKKKRGRPRKSDAEKQAAKDAKHEVKKSKAKSRMHSCEVCGKRFKTNQLMKQHVANFHSNIYNCNECSESFNTPLEYSIHIRMHTEDTHSKFQCVLCDYETPHIEELKNHLKKCSDRAPRFTCTICKKGFNVRTWYLEHANYHTGDKPFVCEICGKAFIYSRYLSAHRSTQHKFNGEEKKLHHCTLCDKVYQHRNSLAIHMNTHTGNGAVCDICGKLLSSKEKLKFHMRIHSGYKPFKCTYCEKAFIKKTILVEHIRIHTGEKPYRCEYCHKCFSQRSSMVTHVRGHTGERPHVCHFCGKGFVAKAMLNLHFKTCKGYNYPPQQ